MAFRPEQFVSKRNDNFFLWKLSVNKIILKSIFLQYYYYYLTVELSHGLWEILIIHKCGSESYALVYMSYEIVVIIIIIMLFLITNPVASPELWPRSVNNRCRFRADNYKLRRSGRRASPIRTFYDPVRNTERLLPCNNFFPSKFQESTQHPTKSL